MRSSNVGTLGEEVGSSRAGAETRATHPVLEARFDEMDTDEHDGRAGDDRRQESQQDPSRNEGDEDFQEGADSTSADDGTVSLGTGERLAICIRGAVSVGVHLGESTLSDGKRGEGDTDDRDEASTEEVT